MNTYISNIEQKTLENSFFREVLYTSQHIQLVVMALPPKGEIGVEVHPTTDQFFRIEAGTGTLVVNGESHQVKDGDAIVVPAGTQHNLINSSETEELKLYTLYAPPHHKDGILHKTREEAEADTTDHL